MPGGELALEPFTGHAPSYPVIPVVEGICDDVRAKVPSRMSCQRQVWHMGPGILEVFIVSIAPLQSCVLRIIEQNNLLNMMLITMIRLGSRYIHFWNSNFSVGGQSGTSCKRGQTEGSRRRTEVLRVTIVQIPPPYFPAGRALLTLPSTTVLGYFSRIFS